MHPEMKKAFPGIIKLRHTCSKDKQYIFPLFFSFPTQRRKQLIEMRQWIWGSQMGNIRKLSQFYGDVSSQILISWQYFHNGFFPWFEERHWPVNQWINKRQWNVVTVSCSAYNELCSMHQTQFLFQWVDA